MLGGITNLPAYPFEFVGEHSFNDPRIVFAMPSHLIDGDDFSLRTVAASNADSAFRLPADYRRTEFKKWLGH
jgi:hypothetical protein